MKNVIVLAISGIVLWSCNSPSEKSSANQDVENHAEHHHHHHDDVSGAIELDNGEKWVVNEEMKPFVVKGEELVNAYVQNAESDYKALAAELKNQNDQLIQSCTMQGKGHDELHKWLHPHLEIVQSLENETDAAKANETVLQLQQSYQQYHQYFN